MSPHTFASLVASTPRAHVAAWCRRGVGAALAVALLLSAGGANAQGAGRTLEVTDYLRDYNERSHAYMELSPLVPRIEDASPWLRVREALMPGRHQVQTMYLLGDDRIHMYPTKVGVLGWGLCAGLQF